MKTKTLGSVEASVIGLGAWAIGGGTWWGDSEENEAIEAIRTALDNGITLIDTAPAYNYGKSEELVGKALNGIRHKAVISTKCGLWWGDATGEFFIEHDGIKLYRNLSPRTIRLELEASLGRLQTDYIDIYHTHWQMQGADKTPIAETMDCLLSLKKEGKIRAIAVSNAGSAEIEEYLAAGKVDGNQAKYSILDRHVQDILPTCIANGIKTMAYSPLEQGLLTGKIGMDAVIPDSEARSGIPWIKPQNRMKVLNMLDSFKPLTEKYNCTIGQLIIAWTLEQEGIDFVLCGGRKSRHVIENAGAGAITITADDCEFMTNAANMLGTPE